MERPTTTWLSVHRSPIPARPRNSMLNSGSIWPDTSKPTSKPPAPWPKPKPPWRLPPRQHKRKRSAKPRSAKRQLRSHPKRDPLPRRLSLLQGLPPHPQLLLRPPPLTHRRAHSGCSHLPRPSPLQLNRREVSHSNGEPCTVPLFRI